MRLIFAGSGAFGVPALRHLIGSRKHKVVQVVTQPDRPAGRGRKMTPTPVAQLATEHGLPLLRTADINGESLPGADLLLVIAFGQKIAPRVVDHPRLGSINLHGSRLPRYRGAAPVNWAIIRGETITGNSVIRLAEKMDAGNVLAQSSVEIEALETSGELHDRLALDGVSLIERVLGDLAEGKTSEAPQDHALATLAPRLKRAHGHIEWSRPAVEIANQIRGIYPWPGCRVRLVREDKEVARVTLVRARACGRETIPGASGEIAPDGTVGAGGGGIEIVELQPDGRRSMSLTDYRHGHRWEPSMRLESLP